MPLTDIPMRMPWGEALRLTQILAGDPSSSVAAALGEWSSPVSREWLLSANLLDVYIAAHTRKGATPDTYPRPWDKAARAVGAGTSMTLGEWREMRARLAGPQPRPRDAKGRFVKAGTTT